MLDQATTARARVAEETSLALNGIGISPVVSGSVDLKLCLSRHAAG